VTGIPVRARLAELGLAAHRRRGQNFLVDPGVAQRIVEAADPQPGEAVLEIGTGLGILTAALAVRAERVLSVEIDAGLVRAVREAGELPAHVELLHADALKLDLRQELRRFEGPVRVVANLPYSVSSPLLRRFLELRDRLSAWVVLLQREVAERLLAAPGSPAYASFTVLHQLTVSLQRLFEIPPGCFHPRPRVVSTLVRVIPLTPGPLRADELPWVERVVRAAFGQRRKMLANALRTGLGVGEGVRLVPALEELGVDPRARAETLLPEQLLAVARALRGPKE
jgi:16S rRNA (adenine1518-N6/adenine1519-N6)-dimethyltransferase